MGAVCWTLIAAGLGYTLTYKFGKTLIADCEEAARELLKSVCE